MHHPPLFYSRQDSPVRFRIAGTDLKHDWKERTTTEPGCYLVLSVPTVKPSPWLEVRLQEQQKYVPKLQAIQEIFQGEYGANENYEDRIRALTVCVRNAATTDAVECTNVGEGYKWLAIGLLLSTSRAKVLAVIVCIAASSEFDNLRPDFDRLIESFRVIDTLAM